MTRTTQKANAWNRGYYCAVAVLLRETGTVDTNVKSLFEQGGRPELADDEDQELFRNHGLMPPNNQAHLRERSVAK